MLNVNKNNLFLIFAQYIFFVHSISYSITNRVLSFHLSSILFLIENMCLLHM